jgi:hypothetical protein
MAQRPIDMSDTSTTAPWPVRSRWNGRCRCPGESHAGLQIAEARPRHGQGDRCVGRRDADRGAGAQPVGDAVEAPPFGQLALGSLGAAPGVDDPRVAALDVLGLDAQLAAGGGQEVGDEDVGLVDELHQHLLALGGGEVEGHRPLAPIGHLPQVRHTVDVGGDAPRGGVPTRIAEHRVLDLQDVCAQSASTAAADGTNAKIATSSTRTPSSGAVIGLLLLVEKRS